jgi:ArsR family transcriptional regulator, lead/cadmium/zinc/bismuth-responsive transcriptional repressor
MAFFRPETVENVLTYEHMFIYSYPMTPTATQDTQITRPQQQDPACETTHALDRKALAALQPRLLGPKVVSAISDVFKLLGDPTRVRLVDALVHGERCVCDLATLVGLSESAVSHQLRLLRAARLVRVRRAGRSAFYSLDDHHVVGLLHDTRKHVEEQA